MPSVSFPSELTRPVLVSDQVILKVMLDLTVYLTGPTEAELDALIDIYERLSPPSSRARYKIAEFPYWHPLAQPVYTASGRTAAAANVPRAFLQPVRNRIRDGRALEAQYWDGRTIDDPAGSWSLNCQRIHQRETGLFAFARFLMPLDTNVNLLRALAAEIADAIGLYSGHAGPTFAYDPWMKGPAFDHVYARARRFWGMDVEDLNVTLPLTHDGIKGVNWLTLVGRSFAERPEVAAGLADPGRLAGVTVENRANAVVLVAGPAPAAGDQHRPDRSLDPYYAAADVLKPLFFEAHPDFTGDKFGENANTIGWVRRFLDPAGWR
jgi:hypothetical protein